MQSCWRWSATGAVIVVLLSSLGAAPTASEDYAPVSSVPAAHAALQSNLKTVQDWLNDKDFASAARAAQALAVLAATHAHQGNSPAWREQTSALADVCSRLASAARAKKADDCTKLVKECNGLLEQLAKTDPGERAAVKNFKPAGSVATWMLLMDGSYVDAKSAKNPKELANLAQAIAEEANVVYYLRDGDQWHKTALDVREAALQVSKKAQADDLDGARTALKGVYRSCEACHDGFRKR